MNKPYTLKELNSLMKAIMVGKYIGKLVHICQAGKVYTIEEKPFEDFEIKILDIYDRPIKIWADIILDRDRLLADNFWGKIIIEVCDGQPIGLKTARTYKPEGV